jgi:hypothetical protein
MLGVPSRVVAPVIGEAGNVAPKLDLVTVVQIVTGATRLGWIL